MHTIWFTFFSLRGLYGRRTGTTFNFLDFPHLHKQHGLTRFARHGLTLATSEKKGVFFNFGHYIRYAFFCHTMLSSLNKDKRIPLPGFAHLHNLSWALISQHSTFFILMCTNRITVICMIRAIQYRRKKQGSDSFGNLRRPFFYANEKKSGS